MRLFLLTIYFIAFIELPAHSNNVIYEDKSVHGNIQVTLFEEMLCMRFKGIGGNYSGRQGCTYRDSRKMIFSYTKVLMGSLFIVDSPKRVLIIGLGVGTLPLAIRRTIPGALVDVVEIDPNVIKVAKTYFEWPDGDDLLVTHIADGRQFVLDAISRSDRYDIVLLDAFDDEYIPRHLMTLGFLEEIKKIMQPEGIFGVNTFASSKFYDNESVTYQIAFGDYFNIFRYENSGNRVILAMNNKLPKKSTLDANAKKYKKILKNVYGINVDDLISNMQVKKNWDKNAKVIKDH